MNTKVILIVLGLIFFLLIMLILVLWLFKDNFPSNNEIEVFFSEIERSNKKCEDINKFLYRIKFPKNKEQDLQIEEIISRLKDLYLETEDNNILKAFDDTDIDGGFATFVCSNFYSKIIGNEKAKSYYKLNPKLLERCIGISFPEMPNLQTDSGQ